MKIVKSNERREPFDEGKLIASLNVALEKRPVSSEQIENAIQNIKDYIRKIGWNLAFTYQLVQI